MRILRDIHEDPEDFNSISVQLQQGTAGGQRLARHCKCAVPVFSNPKSGHISCVHIRSKGQFSQTLSWEI